MGIGDMSFVQVVCYGVCMLGVVILMGVLRQWYFSVISDVPGPMLGSCGTCFQLWEIYGGRINERLAELHRGYGMYIHMYISLLRFVCILHTINC